LCHARRGKRGRTDTAISKVGISVFDMNKQGQAGEW
jgi:hypothetical protein